MSPTEPQPQTLPGHLLMLSQSQLSAKNIEEGYSACLKQVQHSLGLRMTLVLGDKGVEGHSVMALGVLPALRSNITEFLCIAHSLPITRQPDDPAALGTVNAKALNTAIRALTNQNACDQERGEVTVNLARFTRLVRLLEEEVCACLSTLAANRC